MHNICAYSGLVLLTPGHYAALSTAKTFPEGDLYLFLHPYEMAQLGKKEKKEQNNFPPCSIFSVLQHLCTWRFQLDFLGNK